ncbi:2,4-dihydroxyhept-2-ene-1,7-dioic acid aldolase [Hypericibacter adhaerens]|jgi:2-keto-3-deoxy-L-rhamnonate aldolase RhmA|uniref:2,4-dihydroxyhept-2-ene-1,7-dioic acid aldolase n=1 Tax=Hypericibacter adhaerens TaxID=2602016 RepID=A0A5J6N130_9PROT|nr:aldolase/citrate lyase family protein [Hypericibacter adhaerens]QEX23381.1 2,4-dihydroxyhept-2-ene-1,7-dioic acid aldolase [Hypericibacter adhaerens]
MPVKPNAFASRLAKGDALVGTWVMLARNPAVLPMLKSTGLDFAKVDMEHTPISLEAVADMAMVARGLDFPLVVRPPEGSRVWITRLLDAGVWNLYIPQIHNPDMMRDIVTAARHAPLGNRGTFEPGPQNDYTLPDEATGDLGFLNGQVHLTVMLESIEAFRNLDDIVSIEGVDAFGMGPADLAQELGIYGTPREAGVIEEYKERLAEAVLKQGKVLEMGTWSLEEGRHWVERGARIITYKTDTTALRDVFSGVARDFQSHMPKAAE